jgi:hypothetical protein
MTKKDYVLLAKWMPEAMQLAEIKDADGIACTLADHLEGDNPEFNRAKFLRTFGIIARV